MKCMPIHGLVVLVGSVLTLSGCLAAATTPSSTRLSSVGHISVVPVESPPLLAPSLGSGPVASSAIPVLTALPEGLLQPGGRILASVGGIITLFQIAAAGQPTGEPRRLDDVLADPETWIPTRVLAEEAAVMLRGRPPRTVTAGKYLRLPISDRAATWHMENWYKPIRAWFSEDNAGSRYEDLSAVGSTAVLEVGLINYEWHGPRFLVQILVKLVDSQTGEVIGRTRQHSVRKVGSAEKVLAKDVAPLKQLFREMTRPLVEAALQELGLIER